MTPDRMADVPNKPKTPMRSFRVDDADWYAAKANAEAAGLSWNDELRKFVRRAAKRKPKS